MKFTIEEIRNYLKTQDSFGDVVYNLSEENIIKANTPKDNTEDGYIDDEESGFCGLGSVG